MIQDFTTEERKLLIAVARLIATQDNRITDGELEQINLISEQEGFEDFQELFNQVDKEVKTLKDISKLVNQVTWKDTQEYIISFAIAIARADGFESPEEHDIISYLCRTWNITVKEIPDFADRVLVTRVSILIKKTNT